MPGEMLSPLYFGGHMDTPDLGSRHGRSGLKEPKPHTMAERYTGVEVVDAIRTVQPWPLGAR
jgi:hypothetical protein